jgi:TolB protein
MKMKFKQVGIVLLAVGLAGCNSTTQNNGGGVTKNPPVTVIDKDKPVKPDTQADKPFTMDQLERLDGLYAQDWLNEKELLIAQTNPDAKKIDSDSGPMKPSQLYIYNLETKQVKALKSSEDRVHESPIVSPDGQYVFFHENTSFMMDGGRGVLVHVPTGNSRIVTDKDMGGQESGQWADPGHLIVGNGKGAILEVGTDGKDTALLTNGNSSIFNYTAKTGNTLFYVNGNKDNALAAFNVETKKETVVDKSVWRMSLSPDGTQLAMVKSTGDTERTLFLMNSSDTSKRTTLAVTTQMYAFDWSPDSAYMVFAVYSKDKDGLNGVYVANAKTGKIEQLGDFQDVATVAWSPSGKQIMVSSSTYEDNKPKLTTYRLVLK